MGTVYLGVHQLLGRQAAVKVLHPQFAHDGAFVSRFFQEARVVNEIHHPNIVDIIDFITQDDPPRVAYVMEYVAGTPLDQGLRRTRFTAT